MSYTRLQFSWLKKKHKFPFYVKIYELNNLQRNAVGIARNYNKAKKSIFYLVLLFASRNGVNILRLCLVTSIMLQQKRKNTELYRSRHVYLRFTAKEWDRKERKQKKRNERPKKEKMKIKKQ